MLDNVAKKPMFTVQEREKLLKKVTAGIANVEVYSFSGLLVDFMKRFDSAVIIKAFGRYPTLSMSFRWLCSINR